MGYFCSYPDHRCYVVSNSFAEGERFAKANDLLFLEASAKTGDYVEETMVTAAINVLERLNNGQFRPDDEVLYAISVYDRCCECLQC